MLAASPWAGGIDGRENSIRQIAPLAHHFPDSAGRTRGTTCSRFSTLVLSRRRINFLIRKK